MKNKRRLSIVIPSYDRLSSVKRTVAALYSQLSEECELFIIDNGSTPPYQVDQLCEPESKHVHLLRNRTNIGGLANILRCFEVAETDYFWLLGDDDLPTGDAVQRIMAEVDAVKDVDYISFSTGYAQHSARVQISGLDQLLSEESAIKGASLISSGVYRTAAFRPLLPEAYSLIGCGFPHLGLIILAARSRDFRAILSESNIAHWSFNPEGRHWPILLMLNLICLTESLDTCKRKKAFLRAIQFERGMIPRMLIELAHLRAKRRMPKSSATHFCSKIVGHYAQIRPLRGFFLHCIARAIILMPGASFMFLRTLYQRTTGKEFRQLSKGGEQYF